MQESKPHDQTPAPISYGALATRLNEALGRARQALDAHTVLLPGANTAHIDALLAELERRRVRIALYGEVKAGKSSLLNAIAGAPLSPVAFDPLTSIPLRVTYGPSTAWRFGERRLETLDELEQLMRQHDGDAVEVVVETDLDLLHLGGQLDLLDTPGVGSEAQLDAVTSEALQSLDAVVLVVRYPALFTQFTRTLMSGLQSEIGKLFVVWNLDAACRELDDEERSRHAETLRHNVAGAHDMFLVDARAGFEAAQRHDSGAVAGSGLEAFRQALAAFAGSNARDLAAVREAAKRAHRWLTRAQRLLADRHATLDRDLRQARRRIDAVRSRADGDAAGARARQAELETALARAGEEATQSAGRLADDLRRQLRAARRRWIRRGDVAELKAAVDAALAAHADAAVAATQTLHQAIQAEMGRFGAPFTAPQRPRTTPAAAELSPEERSQRAVDGHVQLLRRALWRRWYLPGLADLESAGVDADLEAQRAWREQTAEAARKSAAEVLAQRLAEIQQRAAAQIEQIRTETSLESNQAEFDRLGRDLPVVIAQVEAVSATGEAARALL